MNRIVYKVIFITFICSLFIGFFANLTYANESAPLSINHSTTREDMYPVMDILKLDNKVLTIDNIITKQIDDQFVSFDEVNQKKGFFYRVNWLRFDIENKSDANEWILEFAFPLINELELYEVENNRATLIYQSGAEYPFKHREVKHRHFAIPLHIEQDETKSYYAMAIGSGDLHPPITLWSNDAYVEKTQTEFMLIGIFYGVVLVMIFYNLFLFIGLRMKSYLYYVILIVFTLIAKMSINGLAYQYLWPDAPIWHIHSAPFFVPLACMFTVIFTRNFLDLNRYLPSFTYVYYILIATHLSVIVVLPFSRFISLYMMVTFAIVTFFILLSYSIVALFRGARQARFYIVGWLVFLTGVSITILERAVIIPFSIVTEYAGQASLTIEVVLLSLALADKINMIRAEKEIAEKKSKESQELALQSLKEADELKDEFLAVTSHELRTPLYGIIGIAESLKDGIAGRISNEMEKQLSLIVTSGNRLTHLVNDILDFSKLKYNSLKLKFKPIYINGIADIVIAVTQPLLKNKNIQIVNEIESSLPPIKADEYRIQQVFFNLIDNAIKYTDEGTITLSATTTNENVTIHVTDTGRGISNEKLNHIFHPFQQIDTSLSRENSGVGIGLNITKNLVNLHDGTLHVTSREGIGSTFSVTLPIYYPLHEEKEEKKEIVATTEFSLNIEPELHVATPVTSEGRPTVLVADDEAVNLQVLMNQLTLNNYDVLTAKNGEEALQIIDEHNIDLLILDIMMPGISGFEVCQMIREKYSLMDLPILMLTAKNQLKDKFLSFEAGANDYLVKPCNKQELISRVKTLVQAKLLNQRLIEMNIQLEERIKERTIKLELANDELQRMNDELLKMARSRRKLLANVAHELGTPMTLIHNYMESLQQGFISIEDERYKSIVFDKINVLNRLIDDLFDLSKLEEGETSLNITEVPLHKWIERIVNKCEIEVTLENRQFTSTILHPNLSDYFCYIDNERIDQVFSNLISNAIKHTKPKSGKINVHVARFKDDHLLVQVNDNGTGIDEGDLPYVFDRFYTDSGSVTTVEQHGSGLGLAIVKQIVESHHGTVSVESNIEHGTSFNIKIPIVRK